MAHGGGQVGYAGTFILCCNLKGAAGAGRSFLKEQNDVFAFQRLAADAGALFIF